MITTTKYSIAVMYNGVTSSHKQTRTYVEQIVRDRSWWDQQPTRLKEFYFDAVLPELGCQGMARVELGNHQDQKKPLRSTLTLFMYFT